jgi:hypothetical protein
LQIDAANALDAFETSLASRPDADAIMIGVCALLGGEQVERSPLLDRPSYREPSNLRRLIPLVYRHVRPKDDVHREGGYTPDARDHAQDFRNRLIELVAESDDRAATDVLRRLADDPVLALRRDWILHKLELRRQRFADLEPWTERDIRQFAVENEIDPKTDRDLSRIALKRLSDIKHAVETSDGSLGKNLREGDHEDVLRRWLAHQLRARSRERYTVPEEVEIDQEQRPDIRLEHPRAGSISIEVKWAQKWTLPQLLDGLEHQLVGKYLRAHDSRYGIYVLGMIGSKASWHAPDHTGSLDFEGVLERLQGHAAALKESSAHILGLEVVSIDFRDPKPMDRKD